MDALAQAGGLTSWRGIQAISDYKATQPITNMPSLVLVGEYDFCTVPCIEGWSDLIVDPAPQRKMLTICSHYGMLEDERTSIRNGHFGVLATTRSKVKYSKPSYHSYGTYYEYVEIINESRHEKQNLLLLLWRIIRLQLASRLSIVLI
jgi:hypothetical protein